MFVAVLPDRTIDAAKSVRDWWGMVVSYSE